MASRAWEKPGRGVFPALLVHVTLAAGVEAQAPRIEITRLPEWNSGQTLRGRVSNVDPSAASVAVYLHPEGAGWWVKPSEANPCSTIAPDGTFETVVVTGGVDQLATHYAVFLSDIGDCPVLRDAPTLPEELLRRPAAFAQRSAEVVRFSGRLWRVRDSPYLGGPPAAPGAPLGNCFSRDHVSVDHAGHLRLRLAAVPPAGYCSSPDRGAEVWLSRSLGYGEYRLHTLGRVDLLADSAVFGVFLWDPISGPYNREMDFEVSRWCVPGDANGQFVVQPHSGPPGHLHRFPIALTDDNSALTFLMRWHPGMVTFSVHRGHHFGAPPPDALVAEQMFTSGVPIPGRERFRLNLWRFCAPMAPQEVVVTHFSHKRLARMRRTPR